MVAHAVVKGCEDSLTLGRTDCLAKPVLRTARKTIAPESQLKVQVVFRVIKLLREIKKTPCPRFESRDHKCKPDSFHLFSLFSFLTAIFTLVVNVNNNNNLVNNNNDLSLVF